MKARYTYSINPDVEDLLDKLAKANNRSKSSMLETLVAKEFNQAATYMSDGLRQAREIFNKEDPA